MLTPLCRSNFNRSIWWFNWAWPGTWMNLWMVSQFSVYLELVASYTILQSTLRIIEAMGIFSITVRDSSHKWISCDALSDKNMNNKDWFFMRLQWNVILRPHLVDFFHESMWMASKWASEGVCKWATCEIPSLLHGVLCIAVKINSFSMCNREKRNTESTRQPAQFHLMKLISNGMEEKMIRISIRI